MMLVPCRQVVIKKALLGIIVVVVGMRVVLHGLLQVSSITESGLTCHILAAHLGDGFLDQVIFSG